MECAAYSSRGNTMLESGFYNMDCMEALPDYPDGYFDLAVIDPPYGIKVFLKNNPSRSKKAVAKDYKQYAGGDMTAPGPEFFSELKRVSRNQVIFGANHFIGNIEAGFRMASGGAIGADSPCWIVWDKDNGKNDFADAELAYTSFKTAVRIFKFRWAGMLQGNMKDKEARIHPTQKPVALYDWIFENYAKPGQKILDTHVGSASSLIAARHHGLDFVGFELDKDYYKAASARFERETAQMELIDILPIRLGGKTMKKADIKVEELLTVISPSMLVRIMDDERPGDQVEQSVFYGNAITAYREYDGKGALVKHIDPLSGTTDQNGHYVLHIYIYPPKGDAGKEKIHEAV